MLKNDCEYYEICKRMAEIEGIEHAQARSMDNTLRVILPSLDYYDPIETRGLGACLSIIEEFDKNNATE